MPQDRLGSDAARLRRAVSALTRRLRAQDEPGSLGPTGLGILARLMRGGVTNAAAIAQQERLAPQSLTRSLKSLHDAGLIDRWADEGDRRRTSLALTPKGEELLKETVRKRTTWLSRVMSSRLRPGERETLRAASSIMERLAGGADPGKASDLVINLVPEAHVANVERSLEFYARLGFIEDGRFEHEGQLVWASMHGRAVRAARIMFSLADEVVDPKAQGIGFYCWTDNVVSLHERLTSAALTPTSITHPHHMPDGEFGVLDPDGYHLRVGQLVRRQ